ncbi:hypothetical protein AAES_84177 [Amazona aestiva]|uniref:Uncharacterized protein n=1 Tax=Amazona aestiva TaxID=12930 RepID=A0A0Q3TKU6_AMAAE|nr:hypothetical protein AAES_84177 [Amazona aestiva]
MDMWETYADAEKLSCLETYIFYLLSKSGLLTVRTTSEYFNVKDIAASENCTSAIFRVCVELSPASFQYKFVNFEVIKRATKNDCLN